MLSRHEKESFSFKAKAKKIKALSQVDHLDVTSPITSPLLGAPEALRFFRESQESGLCHRLCSNPADPSSSAALENGTPYRSLEAILSEALSSAESRGDNELVRFFGNLLMEAGVDL